MKLLETPIVTEEGTFVSYSLFKDLDAAGGPAAWEAFQALYDLPETLTDDQLELLGFTWDDVGQINVGTRSETEPVSPIRVAKRKRFLRRVSSTLEKLLKVNTVESGMSF